MSIPTYNSKINMNAYMYGVGVALAMDASAGPWAAKKPDGSWVKDESGRVWSGTKEEAESKGKAVQYMGGAQDAPAQEGELRKLENKLTTLQTGDPEITKIKKRMAELRDSEVRVKWDNGWNETLEPGEVELAQDALDPETMKTLRQLYAAAAEAKGAYLDDLLKQIRQIESGKG